MTTPSRWGRGVGGAGFLGALVLLILLAFSGDAPLRIYPGPADRAYSVELPARYRVGEASFFRWTGREAGFDLPWRLRSPAVLTLHYALRRPSTGVELLLDGERVGHASLFEGVSRTRFVMPPGRSLSFRLLGNPAERLRASIFSLEIDAKPGGIVPRLDALAVVLALPLVLLALLTATRVPWGAACAIVLAVTAASCLLIRLDPLASVRLAQKLIVPVTAIGAAAAVLMRRRPVLFGAFLVGLILRLGIVLHPFAYHYDHAAHAGLVQALRERGLVEFWKEKEALQLSLNVGELQVAGEKRAFPYPTLFYSVSAAVVGLTGNLDTTLSLLAAVASSLEVLAVALIAGSLGFSPRARDGAGWVAALYPASYGVLTIALYPSLVAHVAEVMALGFFARGIERPSRPMDALTAASVLLAGALHVASLINLAVFAAALGLVTMSLRPVAVGAAGVASSLLVSYRSMVADAAGLMAGLGPSGPGSDWLKIEPPQQFGFMGGWWWPALGVLGLVLAGTPRARRFLVSWAAAFAVLRLLRILLGPLGAHLKELQWAAPLVALGAGIALDHPVLNRYRFLWPLVVFGLSLLAFAWIVEHERWLWPLRDWPISALEE